MTDPGVVTPDKNAESEALREALAAALWADYSTRYSEDPRPSQPLAWSNLEPIEQEPWLADITPLMPLVVAYGDQRAAEALREAAADVAARRRGDPGVESEGPYVQGFEDWLLTRADEIHGRQA